MYEALKWLHVGCVIISGAGFVSRGMLMLAGSPLLRNRFARVAPHIVDTLLLSAAVGMTVLARLSPLAQPWLAAKIAGLAAYIALGAIALRYGRSRRVRAGAFFAAMLVFAYVAGTALSKDASWPWQRP